MHIAKVAQTTGVCHPGQFPYSSGSQHTIPCLCNETLLVIRNMSIVCNHQIFNGHSCRLGADCFSGMHKGPHMSYVYPNALHQFFAQISSSVYEHYVCPMLQVVFFDRGFYILILGRNQAMFHLVLLQKHVVFVIKRVMLYYKQIKHGITNQ